MVLHWYLFVILFGVHLFARAAGQYYTVPVAGEEETRYRWFPVLVLFAVLTYVAATRDASIGDTSAYIAMYRNSPASLGMIPYVLENTRKDKGFSVLMVILKSILGNNHTLFFGIIAGFCMLVLVTIYRKYSPSFFMSMFLFLASSDYIQWTHNGMRQFIAVCIIFAGTDWLLQKKYMHYIALVLLASVFHASALIMIPMCFIVQGKPWNTKTVLFILAVIAAVSSVDALTNVITEIMENTQYAGEVNQFLNNDGANVLRVLVFAIPPLMSLVFRNRLLQADVPIINLATGMSIASVGTYLVSMFTSGMFIGRIPIFFSLYNYILLPWVIHRTFEKHSATLINLIMMGCYAFFYYYQVQITWG